MATAVADEKKFEIEPPDKAGGFEIEAPAAPVEVKNLPGATPRLLSAASSLPTKLTQPTAFEKERDPAKQEGALSHIGGKLKEMFTPDAPGPMRPSPVGSKASDIADYSMGGNAGLELGREVIRQHDRPLPTDLNTTGYRAATMAAPLVMGLDPEAMEKASDVGNKRAVLGEAAVPAGIAAAPMLGEGAAKGLSKIGEAAPAAGKAVLRKVGAPFAAGLNDQELLTRALQPRAKATGFPESLQRASADIKKYDAESPISNSAELHEALPEIKDKIWKEEVEPALTRQAKRPIDMSRTAEAVRQTITPETEEFDPGQAKDLKELADKLEKARDVQGANRLLKYANGKLESYFSKYPSARRSSLMNNPETAGWEAARQTLRKDFLQTLEDAGETGVRDARERYGAISEVQKEVERRPNVEGRQKGLTLSRLLGLLSGGGAAALAHPVAGAAMYGLGELATHMTKPDVLLRRGIAKIPEAPTRLSPATPPTYEPRLAYRAHDEGNPAMDLERSHAHATGSLEEAQKYAEHRGEGKPQKVSTINLDRLQNVKDYEEMAGPNGVKWYKFKRQLGENEMK